MHPSVLSCILFQNAGEETVAYIDKLRFANGSVPTADLRLRMQKAMQTYAAVFRDGPTLQEGCKQLDALYKEMDNIKVGLTSSILLLVLCLA